MFPDDNFYLKSKKDPQDRDFEEEHKGEKDFAQEIKLQVDQFVQAK